MSIPLTVNGDIYNYPQNRESPSWGEDATDWASAVTDVLGSIVGTGDILQTSATIANNISSPTSIPSFNFDPILVRGAVCIASIYRVTTGGGATELAETVHIYLTYKSTAGSWEIAVVGTGSSGVTFSITNGGQVQYTSTNITGSAYSGTIKFKAQALSI